MSEPKVAREVAEADFERFAEEMALDIDPEAMTEEDRESFDKAKRHMIKAMMAGSLVINEEGEPVFTPVKGDTSPLTFHEWEGGDLAAMGGKNPNNVTKSNALMGAITKTSAHRFAKMKARDYRVCQAIMGFLLGG